MTFEIKLDGRKDISIYCQYKPEDLHQFSSHVYPKRKVSLIISFNRWKNSFGKDESFAQIHIT